MILSQATWIVGSDDLPQNLADEDWIRAFTRTADHNGIQHWCVLSEGDQQLAFNRKSSADMVLLRESVRSKDQVILREYLPLKSDGSLVKTSSGYQYQIQYNAFMLPEQPLNFPSVNRDKENVPHEQRKFIPGTEWLYLKLYVPWLSDVGFRKACVRMNVPVPAVAHWMKVRSGRKIHKPKLPSTWKGKAFIELEERGPDELVKTPSDKHKLAKKIAIERLPFKVPDGLTPPHPLIIAVRENLNTMRDISYPGMAVTYG